MKPLDPRLLPHLAPARMPLAGALVGSVVAGLLVVAQAFAVAAVIASLIDGDAAATADAAWLLAAVTAGRAAAGWVVDAGTARASSLVTTALRRRVLDAALSLGTARLSRRHTGELAVLTTRGVAAVDPYLTRYLPALLLAAVLPPLTVVAIATQDPLSAVIVVATLPLLPVFAVLVGLATRDRADRQWQALSSLSGHFVDVMRGLPTLVAYRRATAQSASIRTITDRYRRATNETLKLAFASSAVLELVATLSVALVAVTVGLRLAGGSLDLETALVVLLLAPEAYWPIRKVGAEFHSAAEGVATFEAADALIAEAGIGTQEDSRPQVPEMLLRRPDAAGAHELPGGIVVEELTVGYPDRDVPALSGFGCHIAPRGLTVVVGPSGAGKSTLLAVLLGELEPSAGSVSVAGHDLGRLDRTDWQSRIAWIPQRPWILPGTVRDNVLLGRPDAPEAEVWAALERVALADLVATLPGGLDEPVGEDGANLSAGERARLALSRAVLAGRPLVLLDEPTAHLDPVTEQVIADTLVWLAARSAVVVVAHKPALVALADHVVTVPAPRSARVVARLLEAPARAVEPVETPARAVEPVETPGVSTGSTSRRLRLPAAAGAGAAVGRGGARGAGRGLGGGPDRDGRLADRPGRGTAARARADGGDRGRAHVRPGPARAAVRRAPRLPRRRPAAAGRAPRRGVRRPGAPGARPAREAARRRADLRGRRRRRAGRQAPARPRTSRHVRAGRPGGAGRRRARPPRRRPDHARRAGRRRRRGLSGQPGRRRPSRAADRHGARTAGSPGRPDAAGRPRPARLAGHRPRPRRDRRDRPGDRRMPRDGPPAPSPPAARSRSSPQAAASARWPGSQPPGWTPARCRVRWRRCWCCSPSPCSTSPRRSRTPAPCRCAPGPRTSGSLR